MISLEGCKNVQVHNNSLAGEVLGKNILLTRTPIAEVQYDKSLKIVESK